MPLRRNTIRTPFADAEYVGTQRFTQSEVPVLVEVRDPGR